MAGRNNNNGNGGEQRGQVNQSEAESVVRESLGLTAEDLGMNRPDDAFDLEPDDGDFVEGREQEDIDLRSERGRREALDDDQQHQQGRQQPREQEDDLLLRPTNNQIPPTAEVKADARGNLVDAKTGQVVAKAGAEARMYQKLHTTTKAYTAMQAAHTEVSERLNKAVEIGTQLYDQLQEMRNQVAETSPAKYGLNNDEAIEALTFMREGKTDPVGAIKKILTRAAANGIDLSSIGLAGGNFDPKSLMDLVQSEIGKAMNPLKQRSATEEQQQRQQAEADERSEAAKSELKSFLDQNPDARQYLPVFHQVYSQPKFQHMTLGEVWAKLQLNLMRRPPQQRQGQRPANQGQNRRQGVPNGRGQPPRGGNPATDLAPVSTSYEQIVRDLLK